MPDYATLLLFAIAASALTASPGPDMVLIASRSALQGRLAGFATWCGIALGIYCHALAAALGLSQLFVAVPVAYDIVRFAGALYLLYLAWKTITAKGTSGEETKAGPKGQSAFVLFRQGLYTNLLNPKMAFFVLALFPQFVDPAIGSVALQIMVLATILNTIGLVIGWVIILTASQVGTMLATNSRFQGISRYLLGTLFAGLAVRLAFDSRD